MRPVEIGLVLPMGDTFVDGSTARWADIRDLALRAEELGFDTVWTADELLWRPADGKPQGWWEGVAMTAAVAAATSRVKVGPWVFSALHRNPGITAKAVETIDEISGGRFVFGLGSGHAGRQAHAFGLAEDHVYGRFEEALQIIVSLLREGRADFEGTFHAARDLEQRPRGPPTGPDPDHDRCERPEDAPAGCPACRHLELVRPGTQRSRGVRAAARRARGGVRRGRA
jgi:alkanesulfonate monooxygenase SsuD/methylene tetrahydromethanopterin reductase-like flavin-dependent oxidoreductase (luciferase family)